MRSIPRKILTVLLCCALAFVCWIGLLRLAEDISAARSFRASPDDLQAAAKIAVLPAHDPAFSGSGEYTDAEQDAAASAYYDKAGNPDDVVPLEPIIGQYVSFIPRTAAENEIPSATSENVLTFVVNTSTGVFHRPGCSHVAQMNNENRSSFTGSHDEAAALYTPCKDCNP